MSWSFDKTLEGRFVRMVPMTLVHAEGMLEAATPETFAYMLRGPEPWTPEGFRTYITNHLATGQKAYVVEDVQTGRIVGSSTYLDVREAHLGLEIGHTWITPDRRGTAVNPEMKLLMLAYAFEELGAIRVCLKCDERNLHSQAAIAKLGATREGTWRKASILPDGWHRNTVYFSIIDTDWPRVKEGLNQRLRDF